MSTVFDINDYNAPKADDPFFEEGAIVVTLPYTEDLMHPEHLTTLSPDLSEWLRIQAPYTLWTFRDKPMRFIFKFRTETEAIHFKLRWQG